MLSYSLNLLSAKNFDRSLMRYSNLLTTDFHPTSHAEARPRREPIEVSGELSVSVSSPSIAIIVIN